MSKIEFKPITLEDRDRIQSFTLKGHSQICDLAFSNLYGWSERYRTRWAVVADSLVISFKPAHRSHPAYLMPVCGSIDKLEQVVEALHELSQEHDFPLVLMGIAPQCREALDTLCPERFSYLHDEGSQDYVYLRERMVSLSGKSLQPKRNHINKFERNYPDYSYSEVTEENLQACLELAAVWLDNSGENDSSRLDEQAMIERCLRNREALGLQTGVLSVEGRVVAFSFGSPINENTFGIHVEKANINYEGAFAMINREFARHIPEQYTYLNREEDLGIEGLRKSKQSYKPELLLVKDTAILRR
ncbi:MAG: DUF2156 domain-containing protein [Porphyromonas sp.]|nr:DUF2156 domain-containing protein [Porphyromonas sp.]